MIDSVRKTLPEDHPLRRLFHALTERGLEQCDLHDTDTTQYITDLLTEFINIENMFRLKDESGARLTYLFDMLQLASKAPTAEIRRSYYKHLGDLALFNLGLFPESLNQGHHTLSLDFYAEQGRRSYGMVAELDLSRRNEVFHKLADKFPQCVNGLHWVKLYINDPFYQYMFREFGVT